MNKENLLKVADAIEKSNDDKFYMGSWFGKLMDYNKQTKEFAYWSGYKAGELSEIVNNESLFSETKEMQCGTTACIAGWAFYTAMINNELSRNISANSVKHFAMDYLDLGIDESSNLFFCERSSVWTAVMNDYDWTEFSEDPEEWVFPKADVVDLLRRIANEEVLLSNEWVDARIEPDEYDYYEAGEEYYE